MSCEEQQEEEAEVLKSIYEGDACFHEINPTTYQYKYDDEDENTYKSFLLEVQWGENYPDAMPTLNMDLFYNKHIIESVREKIITEVSKQGEDFLGTAMTYTLFEWVKENVNDLVAEQPNAPQLIQNTEQLKEAQVGSKKKEKKEQLTKAQKRRLYDKFGNVEDRPRGWDWVDVVKHLSQTGGQASRVATDAPH